MIPEFLDRYAGISSALQRIHPVLKVTYALVLLVSINLSRNYSSSFYYLFIILLLIQVSRVPFSWFAGKLLLILPFLIILSLFMLLPGIILHQALPLPLLSFIWLKTTGSFLLISLLTAVTPFNVLLGAMETLRFPRSVVLIARFAYTYIFVIFDELTRTLRALKSRVPRLSTGRIRVYGNISAAILVKTYSRSRQIFYSMLSRNFNHFSPHSHPKALRAHDGFCSLFLCLIVVIGAIL